MTGYVGINNKAQKIKNVYFGLNNVARKVKKGYIGVNGVAQLWYTSQREWVWDVYAINSGYNPIEGESSSNSGYSAFYAGTSYTLNQSTGEFTVEQTTQIARSSTGATNAVGKYIIDTYSSSGTYTGSTVYLITAASYSWLTGLSLTLTPYTSQYYENRGSLVGSVTDLDVTAYPINGIQNGYWYVLRHDYTLSYTGNYVESLAVVGDVYYRQIEFQSSGTLTLSKTQKANVWICGGGGCGADTHCNGSEYSQPTNGGAGAYAANATNINIKDLIISLGAGGTDSRLTGGTTTSSGDLRLTAAGGYGGGDIVESGGRTNTEGCGGTGSGKGPYGSVGTGDGLSKKPFNDNSMVSYCDGGGAGSAYRKNGQGRAYGGNGGDGGTDGSNGLTTNSNPNPGGHTKVGGIGGGLYGGNGGDSSWSSNCYLYIDGENAKGYGSGGGGAAYLADYYNPGEYEDDGSGGFGYQGVCFIRIPLE